MKINDSINKSLGLDTDKVAGKTAKPVETAQISSPASIAADPQTTETVTLSPMAAELKKLETKIASTEVFDAKKVEEIKSAIANGKFKVDTEKVADGLVNTVKDLIGNQSS